MKTSKRSIGLSSELKQNRISKSWERNGTRVAGCDIHYIYTNSKVEGDTNSKIEEHII